MTRFVPPKTYTLNEKLTSIWITIADSYKLNETPDLLDNFVSTTFLATSDDKGLELTANTKWFDLTSAYSDYMDKTRDPNMSQPNVKIIKSDSANDEDLDMPPYIYNSEEVINWLENISHLVRLKARFLKASLSWLNDYRHELSVIHVPSGDNSTENPVSNGHDDEEYDSSSTNSFVD
jgi:hypothetical protein